MLQDKQVEEVREAARNSIKALRGLCSEADMQAAKTLVEALRDQRDYELMGQLAEAVRRRDPRDAKNRRLYAEYLIEAGKATAAIDLLQPIARQLPKSDPEFVEAAGLLGRAYKQIFFDAGDKTDPSARAALKNAIGAYRGPYDEDRDTNTWHGVNLIALLKKARALGVRTAPDLDPVSIAKRIVATLQGTPAERRTPWHLPTLAEASL